MNLFSPPGDMTREGTPASLNSRGCFQLTEPLWLVNTEPGWLTSEAPDPYLPTSYLVRAWTQRGARIRSLLAFIFSVPFCATCADFDRTEAAHKTGGSFSESSRSLPPATTTSSPRGPPLPPLPAIPCRCNKDAGPLQVLLRGNARGDAQSAAAQSPVRVSLEHAE